MNNNRRRLSKVLLALVVAATAGRLAAQAPLPAADPCETGAPFVTETLLNGQRAELISFRALHGTSDGGNANPASASFVDSATAVEAWSVAIGNKSSLQGYQFPLTVNVNPFRVFDPDDKRWRQNGIWRSLAQSQLSGIYAPVVLQPRSDHLPGVAETASRTVAGSYKIVLFGAREMDDNLQELDCLAAKGLQEALDDPTIVSPVTHQVLLGRKPEFNAKTFRYLTDALPVLQADLKRQLMVAVKVTYQGDSRPVKPNAVAAELDVSKVLGQSGTPLSDVPVSLAGSLSRSWFGRSQLGATYEQTSVAFGPTATVASKLDLILQGQVDRYAGLGFPGITGVVDTRRRTDLGLMQGVKFGLPINGNLLLSVKELHLGTGNTDVALAALLTLDPGLLHPKKTD